MAQKGGLGLPTYSTSQSGEVHVPVFVSTVKVGEESFEGKPSRTKKQAEMSAAKVAYFTIKEGKCHWQWYLLITFLSVSVPSKAFNHFKNARFFSL